MDIEQRMKTQAAEFDALDDLVEAHKVLSSVAIVDDDYPEVRHRFEGALAEFLAAAGRNGRTMDGRQPPFDLVAHLTRQRAFSEVTFGPGRGTAGVCDHIRKELAEIEADPTDIMEWVDVIILAFDGAWRAGWDPAQIVKAIEAKQARNEARNWPDWRTADPNKAIEHDRTAEVG